MANSELARRIRLGEDSSLGLKSVDVGGNRVLAPHRDSLADEIAAFANGRGGTLVLGVDDRSREVSGIPLDKLDVVERWAQEVCSDSIFAAGGRGLAEAGT